MKTQDKALPKTQADLLEALRNGVEVLYMPYRGWFNPTPYYFRKDNGKRVTAAANALIRKGLVEKCNVTWHGHSLRTKPIAAANNHMESK